MAMTKQLWSINGASTEIGRDRRTIAKALSDTPPDGKIDGRSDGWWMSTILDALNGNGGPDKLDKDFEQARKAKEEADKLAMQNATSRGELIPRSLVNAAVIDAFARVRAKFIAIPAAQAPYLFIMESAAEVEGALRSAIYEALRELSKTDVAAHCGYGDDGDVVADADPAAGPDGQPMG